MSIRLEFDDPGSARSVLAAVAGEIYGNRLPRLHFTADSRLEPAVVVRSGVSDAGDRVTLAVTGDVALAPFACDARTVRWELWKVVSAVLPRALLTRGIVSLHAACLQTGDRTWLVPGASGAGKSTLAFLARLHGARVLASELVFAREGAVVAGNCVLSIARDALTAQGIDPPDDWPTLDGYLLSPTDAAPDPVSVTGIAFPTIAAGQTARGLSGPRTQQLLYENALSQLDTEARLDASGAPLGLSTPIEELLLIARETALLAEAGGTRVAGSARALWEWFSDHSDR